MRRLFRLFPLFAVVIFASAILRAELTPLDFFPRLVTPIGNSARFAALETGGGKRLHVYDLATRTDRTIELSDAGTSVGISADGKRAAVGDETARSITYIDLEAGTVLRRFSTQASPIAVFVAREAIFYQSSLADGKMVRSVALANGSETALPYSFDFATLSADGKSLLAVNTEFRRFLARYPIEGTALGKPVTRSGEGYYTGCGPVIELPGTNRIYSACGAVFRSWSSEELSPQYLGLINLMPTGVADTGSGEYIAGIRTPSFGVLPSELAIYERESMRKLGEIPLTPIVTGGTSLRLYPVAVFPGAHSRQFYVLTNPNPNRPQPNPWPTYIETVDFAGITDCGATFETSAASVDAVGGRQFTAVSAPEGCLYSPVSEAPWLNVLDSAWARGSRTIVWHAGTNPSSSARTGTIRIGGQTLTVTQAGRSTAVDSVVRLPDAPFDSVFSDALDRLVMVWQEPAALGLFNPDSGEVETIPLPLAAVSVRLTGMGKTAVVLHNGFLTYVDLERRQILRTVPSMTDSEVMVTTPSGYTYLLPNSDSGYVIRVRDSDGAAERLPIAAPSFLRGKQWPSRAYLSLDGTTIAEADTFEVRRYHVGPEGLTYLGKTTVPCAVTTLTADLRWAFTQCGRAISLDTDDNARSEVPILTNVTSHNPALRTLTAISSPNTTTIQLLDDTTFALRGQIQIPAMETPEGLLPGNAAVSYWTTGPLRVITGVYSRREDSSNYFYGLSVWRAGAVGGCTVSTAPGAIQAPRQGGGGQISLQTGPECDWLAVSNAPWLKISGGAFGIGSGTVTYQAAPNVSTSARAGSISLGGVTVNVTQAAAPIGFSPASVTAEPGGGVYSIDVVTTSPGQAWTAAASASWIVPRSPMSGVGPGRITFEVTSDGFRAEDLAGAISIGEVAAAVVLRGGYWAPTGLAATRDGLTPRLLWEPAAGSPLTHRVQISTSAGFNGAGECPGCVAEYSVAGSSLRVPAGVLASGVAYWWRVRTETTYITGAWSAAAALQVESGTATPAVVFRRPNGELAWHRMGESGLHLSGGVLAGDPGVARNPVTGVNTVAVRDAYNGLWLNTVSETGQWGTWAPAGGVVVGTPAVAVTAAGAVQVAVRDQYQSYWLYTAAGEGKPGVWKHLAGIFASDPAVAAGPDGALWIVGRDTWGGIWSQRQSREGQWSGWKFCGGVTAGQPSVAAGAGGSAYVAVTDGANSVWMLMLGADAEPRYWMATGGISARGPQALGPDGAGRLAVAIVDPMGASWVWSFAEELATWQAWRSLGGIVTSMAASQASGDLTVAGFDSLGNLWWNRNGEWQKFVSPGPDSGAVIMAR